MLQNINFIIEILIILNLIFYQNQIMPIDLVTFGKYCLPSADILRLHNYLLILAFMKFVRSEAWTWDLVHEDSWCKAQESSSKCHEAFECFGNLQCWSLRFQNQSLDEYSL